MRSSLANCAASVLLGCITRIGRCTCSATQATVAVLPVPVAPSSTTSCSPPLIRLTISAIAVGWSPEGV